MNFKRSSFTGALVCRLFAVMFLSIPLASHAYTCSCLMESKSVSASSNKCGFSEFVVSTPPKYYLIQTIVVYKTASWSGTDDVGHEITLDSDNTWTETDTTAKYPRTPPPYPLSDCLWDGVVTTSYSGSFSWDYSNYSGSDSGSGSVDADGGWTTNFMDYCDFTGLTNVVETNTTTATVDDDTSTSTGSYPGEDGRNISNWNLEYDYTITLSSEFTDDDLKSEIKSGLPNYPDTWSQGGGSAFWSMGSTHGCASGGKLKYHVLIPAQSEKDADYLVTWNETTTVTDPDTGDIISQSINPMEETLVGTGDPVNPVYGSDHEVMMPDTANTVITEGTPSVEKVTDSDSGGNSESPGDGGAS